MLTKICDVIWRQAGPHCVNSRLTLEVPRDHYSDVRMSAMVSQINSVSIIFSTVCSGADQRKHHSSASLSLTVRRSLNPPHKGPVTRKMFPFNDVIMFLEISLAIINDVIGSKMIMQNNRKSKQFRRKPAVSGGASGATVNTKFACWYGILHCCENEIFT